ncbi:MAG TPA: L-idonate 5-dehydrogenase [Microvirga sp.]|jgi:L-idonate 5-dehydrogenase|nr:L-idonate 5-dehydrogenase [Microvirga sp.]
MRGVVIHGPRDLRIEEVAAGPLGPRDVQVRIEAGGICGSDLHYYHHGGFGTVRLREPMALGHEVAGVVEAVGSEVSTVTAGTRVAVDPSRPCGTCRYCRAGQGNQCLDMRFMGSAMRFPHVQGGFRQSITIDEGQAVAVPPAMTMAEAAMAEPLAVCLHAARQAGPLMGARVLVTGCGPIGSLAVLVARFSGASEIVATDVAAHPLAVARRLGATRTIDVAAEPEGLAPFGAEKGTFDVLFEASGNAAALRGALEVLRPGAVIVQVGLGGEMTLPMNLIVAKELQVRGSFRFDREFRLAVDLIGRGLVDVKPLLTETVPFEQAAEAFALASDRSRAMKVQLSFGS